MRAVRSMLLCGIASIAVGACATHPLPKDVTRYATKDIVHKIRCEARDAVRAELIEELKESGDSRTKQLGQQIESGALTVSDFADQLDAGLIGVETAVFNNIQTFRTSSIGYQFTFTITEDNDNTVSAELKDPFTRGLFALTLSGGDKRQRKNERVFTISESFEKLLKRLSDDFCEGQSTGKNLRYPITGTIGIREIVDTFVHLQHFVGLKQPENKGAFVDTLTFQTIYFGTAKPKITLMPASTDLRLTSISGDELKAQRTDIHRVAITITIGEPATGEQMAAAERSSENDAVRALEAERFLRTQQQILDLLD